jgi:adenosylmethionine-8-amino-7-oxononanoate aminotransferase
LPVGGDEEQYADPALMRATYAGWHGAAPMGEWFHRAQAGQCIVEGHGARVRDTAGRWYLDAKAGLWHVTLGYGHPTLVAAIERQLRTLPAGCLVRGEHPPRVSVELANALAARLPAGVRRIRLGTTGSQMVEAAVLLSRCARVAEGEPQRKEVVALRDAYHGAGPGAWALTDEPGHHELYGPLLPGVRRADASLDALEEALADAGPERVTAVMLEPIQGSRVAAPSAAFLREVRELTERHGVHLIVDEVATGMGRTGAVSLAAELGVVPDLLVLGKGLASGYVPAAALAVSDRIYDLLYDGPAFAHGSTADGSPLAAAAGLAVLHALFDEGLLAHVTRIGTVLERGLAQLRDDVEAVVEVGGAGLMQGVRLADADGAPWPLDRMRRLATTCAQAGVLIQTLADRIVLVPPFVIDERDCDEIVETIGSAVAAVARGREPAHA